MSTDREIADFLNDADGDKKAEKLNDDIAVKDAKAIIAKAKADVEAAKNNPEDDIIDIPEWPEPPAPEAFAGLAGDFVNMWEPHTEADRAGLLVQFLVFAGHAIGREPYFVVSGDKHRCNLYALLVGPTSKGRKGPRGKTPSRRSYGLSSAQRIHAFQ